MFPSIFVGHMSGFEVDFIRELKDIENYKLIILPAVARLKSYQLNMMP